MKYTHIIPQRWNDCKTNASILTHGIFSWKSPIYKTIVLLHSCRPCHTPHFKHDIADLYLHWSSPFVWYRCLSMPLQPGYIWPFCFLVMLSRFFTTCSIKKLLFFMTKYIYDLHVILYAYRSLFEFGMNIEQVKSSGLTRTVSRDVATLRSFSSLFVVLILLMSCSDFVRCYLCKNAPALYNIVSK